MRARAPGQHRRSVQAVRMTREFETRHGARFAPASAAITRTSPVRDYGGGGHPSAGAARNDVSILRSYPNHVKTEPRFCKLTSGGPLTFVLILAYIFYRTGYRTPQERGTIVRAGLLRLMDYLYLSSGAAGRRPHGIDRWDTLFRGVFVIE